MVAQCVYIQQYNNVITLTKKVQNNTALKEFTDLVNGGRAGKVNNMASLTQLHVHTKMYNYTRMHKEIRFNITLV